jgi:hypothetical protein
MGPGWNDFALPLRNPRIVDRDIVGRIAAEPDCAACQIELAPT